VVGVDTAAVLAAFDEQVRRRPTPDGPTDRVEHDAHVTRTVPAGDGWAGVTWSGGPWPGGPGEVDAVIAAEVARFAGLGRPWEWKHYSYDQPDDLPARLRAAGFVAETPETLLVAEIAALDLDVTPPVGVELVEVVDARGVADLVAVHDAVFGGDHRAVGRVLLDGVARRPPAAAAVVAVAGSTPVAAGRLQMGEGTDFAGMWGGGTLPAWRHRGVFRALVAHRAAAAAARGFRYLQVDATEDSRPILERLGFAALAVTTPFVHPGTAA
jgi:ribosomal protein S18 acetylase RimI-like enzyme